LKDKLVTHELNGYISRQNLMIPCPECRKTYPYNGEISEWLKCQSEDNEDSIDLDQ